MTTLADELPRQQARCREILKACHEIGPAGVPLSLLLENSLRKADRAAASGDVVAMIQACEELRAYKE